MILPFGQQRILTRAMRFKPSWGIQCPSTVVREGKKLTDVDRIINFFSFLRPLSCLSYRSTVAQMAKRVAWDVGSWVQTLPGSIIPEKGRRKKLRRLGQASKNIPCSNLQTRLNHSYIKNSGDPNTRQVWIANVNGLDFRWCLNLDNTVVCFFVCLCIFGFVFEQWIQYCKQNCRQLSDKPWCLSDAANARPSYDNLCS